MGSPLSDIMAEIFLYLEDSHIKPLLESKCIPFYSRYVNIIIIYDAICTDPETIVQHANSMPSNLKLIPTLQSTTKSASLTYSSSEKPTSLKLTCTANPQRLTLPLTAYLTTQWNTHWPPTDIILKEC